MKNLLRASLFVFAFCFSAFSQTDANSVCPKLDVSGPAGITNFGDEITFTASLDEKATNYNIEYVWTVSDGNEIVSGQGTSEIKVVLKNSGGNTTATVEIKGFPEGCLNVDSETGGVCSCVDVVLLDEFSIETTRIDKARIDNLLNELQNNPNDQGYIIEKFERKTSKATINQKLKKLRDYIVKIRKFDASRIVIVQNSADKNLTQFFRVPLGATPPTIE